MPPVLAVAIGGIVGTGLRLGLDTLLPHDPADFAWSTLIVNIVGAFALGCLAGGLWRRAGIPAWLKAGVGAGVLGSFTTFSAIAVSVVAMTASSPGSSAGASGIGLATVYLGVTIVFGFAAAAGGLAAGSALEHRRMPRSIPGDGSAQ